MRQRHEGCTVHNTRKRANTIITHVITLCVKQHTYIQWLCVIAQFISAAHEQRHTRDYRLQLSVHFDDSSGSGCGGRGGGVPHSPKNASPSPTRPAK